MPDQVLEEKDLSIDEYLAAFDPASADYELIKKRSANLARVVLKKVQDPSGRIFEDTTFIEKTGITYTVRAKL